MASNRVIDCNGRDMTYCIRCRYLFIPGTVLSWAMCNYHLETGKPRPCSAGEGCTVREIGAPNRNNDLFFPSKRGRKIHWNREAAYAMWKRGATYQDIAEAVGTTISAVAQYGLQHWGKRNGSSRPAQWDTKAARAMWEQGATDKEIAEAVGANQKYIARYRHKHWGAPNHARKENEDGTTD